LGHLAKAPFKSIQVEPKDSPNSSNLFATCQGHHYISLHYPLGPL